MVESDESLMRRFQAGDEESFRVLFDRYASRVVNFIHRFLHDREASEDVAQEIFLRVYRAKERYDSSRPFRSWIFSIAARLASNWLRDKKRHPQHSLDGRPDDDGDSRALTQTLRDTSSPLEAAMEERSRKAQAVQECLAALPESQRTAVLLSRFEEMSYEEIAQAMDLSVASVKSLLFRARQTLKITLLPVLENEQKT